MAKEEFAIIYGINKKGKVKRIQVRKSGRTVRLDGEDETVLVHPSNIADAKGWQREATLVWSLTDTSYIPERFIGTNVENKVVDAIYAKAAKEKKVPKAASERKRRSKRDRT